jgi:2-desacetyl-2-hydroxyethyl bacteriochlorophyllide A dehydrogenase
LVAAGLDRALSARGFEGLDRVLARRDVVDWGRARLSALRTRRGLVGGLGVVITRPGRAELRGFDALLPGPGELTVEVLASAISPGTERAQWLRMPNARPELPFEPGYSGAGRVIARGREVEGFEIGALVAVPRARHASVVTVPAAWAAAVPDGVRTAEAALVYLAIIAGYGVRRAGRVAGEPVCVVGAGPIGALAQRLVALEDPSAVTVIARSERRKATALAGGADRFQTVDEPAEGIEAASVIEATGDPAALPTALAAARPGGIVVLLGSPRGVTPDAGIAELQRKGLRLAGAHISALATEAKRSGRDPFAELARAFLDAVAAGKLDVSDLAGEACDPREVGLLYRRLARGEVDAAHLDWTVLPRSERVRRRGLASTLSLRATAHPFGEDVGPTAASAARPATPDGELRFAVIGCGDIGFANARAIAGAAGARIALCHDAVPALAEAVSSELGGEVAESLDEALDPARADAVFLSVPHDLHAPLGVRAAQAGLHVVVEKPLAVDLPSAEEAVAAAAVAGVELSVCFSHRYHTAVRSARALFRAGAVGPLRGVTVVFHADKPQSYWLGGFSGRAPSDWRASRERAGGGVLVMNLAHYIDLVRYIAGAEPAAVTGIGRTDQGAEVEDAVALSVSWHEGAIGSLSASASTRGAPTNRFELWGEYGTVRLEPDAAAYTERALDGVTPGTWTPLALDESEDVRLHDRRLFVERFAQAIAAGRKPDVTAADGLAVQAFIDAAYRAISSGEPVAIAEAVSRE